MRSNLCISLGLAAQQAIKVTAKLPGTSPGIGSN